MLDRFTAFDWRYMNAGHLEHVIEIDANHNGWSEADFRRTLRQKDVTAGVIALGPADGVFEIVPGFIVYQLQHDHYQILNFAVAEHYRGQGFGKFLIDYMKRRSGMSKTRRRLRLVVSDRHFETHCFLRSQGFRARQVIRNAFGRDAGYEFTYSVDQPSKGRPLPGA
jgi:ribosomal protein S18 acetylase RimI-like enzyme